MKKLIVITLLLSVSAFSFAQKNVEFTKENFPDQKKELKEAIAEMESGRAWLEEYGHNKIGYRKALIPYAKAYLFNPDNAELNYIMGKCYLYGSLYKGKAIEYFEKAYALDKAVANDIFYMMGQAHHIRGDWDKAINEFKKYQKILPADAPPSLARELKKKIEECNTGKELEANPVRVFIDNLSESVNSKYPEYGAVITADESEMLFTSRRVGSTGEKIDEGIGEYFEDIYISYHDPVTGKWSEAQNMGKPINTEGHDATVGLSPDGTKMLIYIDDKGDGNIYECDLKGDFWSKPRKLGKNINTEYHESSASFSPDGNTLYFVTDKPGGIGKHDIYKSEWNVEKERWEEATNLGPNINTPYNEEAIYMHPDGKTMYFSSEGHNTMGGYDIFVSEFKNGLWQKPVNIGYPVNTPDNDVFFVVSASGKHGYYSSFTPDGFGEKDIHKITFLGPEKQVILNSEDNLIASIAAPIKEVVIEPEVVVDRNKVTILKGIVSDAVSGKPVEAKIELIDNEKSEVFADFNSNSKTGKYLVSLPSGKNYGLAVKAEGYLFHSENFIIPESAAYQEITKNIKLKKIEIGSTIVLKNIFFDFDKATLRPESTVELENLNKILTDNPSIKVEISGHTDSKGSDEYNLKLSDDRAKAVVDWLINKGIKSDRLIYKGYGETVPIASNDTDEGRQLNRRTEFKIIGL